MIPKFQWSHTSEQGERNAFLGHTGVVKQTFLCLWLFACFVVSYALDVEERGHLSGSKVNMFSNISAEKSLDTQHQYEQGH